MAAGQAARIAAVSSPLGEDSLLLRRLRAVEQVSRSFSFDLELLSEDAAIRHEQLLGQRMTVRYELRSAARATSGWSASSARYRARVDSWLWYLTRSSDCQIYQKNTVPQIVKEVFADYPMAEF